MLICNNHSIIIDHSPRYVCENWNLTKLGCLLVYLQNEPERKFKTGVYFDGN